MKTCFSFLTYLKILLFWLTVLAGIIALNLVIYSRLNSLIHWAMGAIALGPFYLVWMACAGGAPKFPRFFCGLMFVISPFLFIGVISLQGMLAMLNNYPIPLLIIPSLWFYGAAIVIFFPFQSIFSAPIYIRYCSRALVLTGTSVIACFVLNFGFTQFAQHRAAVHFGHENYCIVENNGASFQRTLWISPGKILFRGDWKGITNPHLLAGSLGSDRTHHWSFWAMDFVENDSFAFQPSPSFWPAHEHEKRC